MVNGLKCTDACQLQTCSNMKDEDLAGQETSADDETDSEDD